MASKDIQLGEVMIVLSRLLGKTMTEKQKRILLALAAADTRLVSTTSAVKNIAMEIKCAESSVWDSVSFFKSIGLLRCNGRIEMTKIGMEIAKIIEGDKSCTFLTR